MCVELLSKGTFKSLRRRFACRLPVFFFQLVEDFTDARFRETEHVHVNILLSIFESQDLLPLSEDPLDD